MNYGDKGKYEGEWKDDMKDGKGVDLDNNGDKYEGIWVGNKKQGPGK